MNKPIPVIPVIILVNACIWGATLLLSSRALSGTGMYQQIQHILSGGAGLSILVVGGGLAGLAVKMKSGS